VADAKKHAPLPICYMLNLVVVGQAVYERNYRDPLKKIDSSRSAFQGDSMSLHNVIASDAADTVGLAYLVPFPRQTAISVEIRKFPPPTVHLTVWYSRV